MVTIALTTTNGTVSVPFALSIGSPAYTSVTSAFNWEVSTFLLISKLPSSPGLVFQTYLNSCITACQSEV